MRPVKKIALLHDICGVGKAAMMNMTPILSMMGIEACPIPTVLLSTHTGGYGTPAIYHVPGEYIRTCADHYKKENITFDAIFVGYLGNVDVIDSDIYYIKKNGLSNSKKPAFAGLCLQSEQSGIEIPGCFFVSIFHVFSVILLFFFNSIILLMRAKIAA